MAANVKIAKTTITIELINVNLKMTVCIFTSTRRSELLFEAVTKNSLVCDFRDAVDSGNDLEKAVEGHNCVGQRRRFAGLSDQGRLDGDAPRR